MLKHLNDGPRRRPVTAQRVVFRLKHVWKFLIIPTEFSTVVIIRSHANVKLAAVAAVVVTACVHEDAVQ